MKTVTHSYWLFPKYRPKNLWQFLLPFFPKLFSFVSLSSGLFFKHKCNGTIQIVNNSYIYLFETKYWQYVLFSWKRWFGQNWEGFSKSKEKESFLSMVMISAGIIAHIYQYIQSSSVSFLFFPKHWSHSFVGPTGRKRYQIIIKLNSYIVFLMI